MKSNQQKAFNKLTAMGVPLFENGDNPDGFFISAEDENSHLWCDYYNEYDRFPDFGVHADIRKVLEPLGLFAEWQNPGCLGVWEI